MLINELSTVIEIAARDRKRFKKLMEESKRFESLPIRTRLSDVEVARFAANRYRFPGVEIKARLFRQYPKGEIASHVVGYIGRINDKDLEQLEANENLANYRGSLYMGKIGIEQSYEKELHGITGFEEMETDAAGRVIRVISRTPPISGNNLTLSLDIKLQEVAEKAFGDRRGALVAIDPTTGDVLAFVSKPGFDPNLFVDGIDSENWDLLNNSHRQAAKQSGFARIVSARLHVQAVHGAGWPGAEKTHAPASASVIPGISACPVALTASVTGRRVATAM